MQTILNSIQFKEILYAFLAFFITKQSNLLHFINSPLTLPFQDMERLFHIPLGSGCNPNKTLGTKTK